MVIRPGSSGECEVSMMPHDVAPLALSSQAAEPATRRAAMAAVVVSFALFAALAPFAKEKLAAVPLFIPLNQSVLIANGLVTAVLLFVQLRVNRGLPMLVLACAYLFAALMAVAHLLTFPGVFAASGLLGAGAQTTAYLYVFWHGGFPIAIAAYALLKDRSNFRPTGPKTVAVGFLPQWPPRAR